MIVETAVIGGYLLKKVGDQLVKEAVLKAKAEDQRRSMEAQLGQIALDALDRAGQHLREKGEQIAVPAGLEERFREFLTTCWAAASTGKNQRVPGGQGVLTAEAAERCLDSFHRLFQVDMRGAARKEAVDEVVGAYLEFAGNVAGWPSAEADGPAFRFLVDSFLREFQKKILHSEALFEATRAAWRSRVETLLGEGFSSVADQLAEGFEKVCERLGSQWPLPAPGSWGEVAEAAEKYGSDFGKHGDSPGAAILRNRILKLLRSGDDLSLPHVHEVYVTSRLADDTKRSPDVGREGSEIMTPTDGDDPPLLSLLHHRGITLTGPPGSGKSVEVWTAAVRLAQRLAGGESAVVPVYIRLTKDVEPIMDRLPKLFSSEKERKLVAAALLGMGGARLLLLLDGFDEAGRGTSRRLLDELNTMLEKFPGLSVVLSGRPQCEDWWVGGLGSVLTCRVALKELSVEQQRRLVNLFCERVGLSLRKRARATHDEIEELIAKRDADGKGVSALLRNPLYLTIVVVLGLLGKKVGTTAAELVGAFVRELTLSALEDRLTGSRDPNGFLPDVLRFYEALAARGDWLVAGQLGGVSESELLNALRTAVPEMVGSLSESEALNAVRDDTGLMFQGATDHEGTWTFTVYPIQEYFAARGLVRLLAAARNSEDRRAAVDELLKASWTEELPRYLADLIFADEKLKLADPNERRKLIRALSLALDPVHLMESRPGKAEESGKKTNNIPRLGPSLVLALRDQLIERDADLEDWAAGEGGTVLAPYQDDSVVRQFAEAGVTPDPFTVLCWDDERRRIREQVASVANWLLAHEELEEGLEDGTLNDLRRACADGGVERRIAALAAALEVLLEKQHDRLPPSGGWEVRPYGPTVAAYQRKDQDPSWVLVPHGPFVAGDVERPDELPVRVVNVDRPFWIGFDPVTVEEYAEFVGTKGYGKDLDGPWWGPFRAEAVEALVIRGTGIPRGPDRREPREWKEQQQREEVPVVGVTWFEAAAFCLWRGATEDPADSAGGWGRPFCLPSEAQWEKASRGVFGRRWPWGCAWRQELAVNGRKGDMRKATTVRENFNRSCFGVRGMAGNVLEWTGSRWEEGGFCKGLQLAEMESSKETSVRGGSFVSIRRGLRCGSRGWTRAGDSLEAL